MKVSDLSRQTGVSSHRLRHYEQLGLIRAARTDSGYRKFDEQSLRDVRFVAKCREVGLSLKTIGEVLPSYRTGKLTYDQMIELMKTRILEVEQQIAEQHRIRKELMAASAWFQKRKREAAKRERERLDKSGTSPWQIRRKYSQ